MRKNSRNAAKFALGRNKIEYIYDTYMGNPCQSGAEWFFRNYMKGKVRC